MLTPLHKHALLSSFLYIEGRLTEMEPLLAQGKRSSPFNQHVHDLSPTEAKVVEDYFARIRSTMSPVWRSTEFQSRCVGSASAGPCRQA